jgi:hypothetical protein
MKNLLLFIFSISGVLSLQNTFAQTEKRAKKSEMPLKTLEFIQKTYPNHSKVNFYKEIENDTLYYGAVFL